MRDVHTSARLDKMLDFAQSDLDNMNELLSNSLSELHLRLPIGLI